MTILEKAGIKFESISPDVNENIDQFKYHNPYDIVISLSELKARFIANKNSNNLVLGADTIVVYQNSIMGKPIDLDEAYTFINSLSGDVHQVITGYTLIHEELQYSESKFCSTDVYVQNLTKEEIHRYIKEENILDAAGAYKIQGQFAKYITKINGCYHNVVGLPINMVYQSLQQYYKLNKKNEIS